MTCAKILMKFLGKSALALAILIQVATAAEDRGTSSPGSDWKRFYDLIATNHPEAFKTIGLGDFSARFAPLLEQPALKTNPEFLTFYGTGLAAAAFRAKDIPAPKRDALLREAYGHVRAAATQGNALAMGIIADMLAKGIGVQRDSASALAWYRKAMGALSDKPYKRYHAASVLIDIAKLSHDAKDFEAAEDACRELLLRLTPVEEHPEALSALDFLASRAMAKGNYATAEKHRKHNASTLEKTLLEQALTCQKQAIELTQRGKYAEAMPLAQKAVEVCEQTFGENRATASCLGVLASVYKEMGNYAVAESLYKRSHAIFEKTLFAEDPTIGTSLGNLAELYRLMGNYAVAEPLIKRSLAINEKALGPDHPGTATSLGNLALLYSEMGNFAAAELLYKRGLAIDEKAFGPDHPKIAADVNNLAVLYDTMGNCAAAEPLYIRSVAIDEKTLGPDHPHTASSLGNLALLYAEMGNYAAAEPLLKRSLESDEKALGLEHPQTAVCLNNLAKLYHSMGNLTAAEPLYKRSLVVLEKMLGPDHPQTAACLNNLGLLYETMGNYTAAEPFIKRSLAINEKALGSEHPNTVTGLNNFVLLVAAKGQPGEALQLREQAWRNEQKQRDSIFAFASEREQTAFSYMQVGGFSFDLSLIAERLAANQAARRFAFSVVLSSKAAALEALSRRQADVLETTDPESRRFFADWQNVGTQLAKAVMATPKPGQLTNHLARIAELETRKEAAEQALARASARFASKRQGSRVAPGNVARALASGSALVEFAKYRSFRFSANGKEEKWGDWNYIALILRGGTNSTEPDVALVRLGPADKIEAAVKKWRKAAAPDEQGRRSDKATLDAASQELATLVWKPIVPSLADCRKVYISPDGELSFVSFGALPGSKPDSFVIDDYDITYVATGRDLVRTGGGQSNAPLLVGAPDFGEQQGTTTKVAKDTKAEDDLLAMRPGISDLRSFTALNFPPLPGTRSEVEDIGHLLQERKETANVLTGAKADEATVKAAKHPGILHLATHGFFLPDSGLDEVVASNNRFQSQLSGEMRDAAAGKLWRQMKLKNPMHRSGIALAGANDTIRGRREAGGNDGILTAEEVAGMDLWGTKMVVISACESGLGEAKGGEGVFGLRRAFTMAGAQSLVMTLWAVSDDATRQLMESLYRHLPEQRTPQRALLAAQREWIAKKRAAGLYPHPVHWASFVASGIGLGLEKK